MQHNALEGALPLVKQVHERRNPHFSLADRHTGAAVLITDEEAITAALKRVIKELVVVRGHDNEEARRVVEVWTNAVIGDVA